MIGILGVIILGIIIVRELAILNTEKKLLEKNQLGDIVYDSIISELRLYIRDCLISNFNQEELKQYSDKIYYGQQDNIIFLAGYIISNMIANKDKLSPTLYYIINNGNISKIENTIADILEEVIDEILLEENM